MFHHYINRLYIFCIKHLLQRLTKYGDPQVSTTDQTLTAIFPLWNQFLVTRGSTLNKEQIASGLEVLLSCQSDSNSIEMARCVLLSKMEPENWGLVPSLEKRVSPVMSTWTYQNEVMQWDIAQDELVLDIGSGGWPFKRANHLADKYPDETTHRVEEMVRDERLFFEVDLESLSFEDGYYDFVFCSHVLEHMDNPGQAMRELMRIGRRGYIEVPTRLSDVMMNFTRIPNHHRWHGVVLDNTLVLLEWNEWERRDLGNQFFDALQSDYANPFQDFFERNRDLFFASYHWTGEISFLIIDKHGQIIDSSGGRG